MNVTRKACLIYLIGIFLCLASGTAFVGAQESVSKDYIIGAGDILQIRVWDHNDLNRTVEVAQDGTFSFPFIGKVQAAGKSVFTLEKLLIDKLSDGYLVGPQVTVGVSEYKHKKAFIFGNVNRPGSYVLKPNMRLLELISEAGGFTRDKGSICTIVRSSKTGPDEKPIAIEDASEHETISVNLEQLIAGDFSENVLIEPNDSIYISTAERVFVTGEVRRPGEVTFKEQMTVRQAISMAGGATPKAAINRTSIIRMENNTEVEIKPNLSDPVLPDDIIKVPESYF
jgi:polysaccharide export outer membrane protein